MERATEPVKGPNWPEQDLSALGRAIPDKSQSSLATPPSASNRPDVAIQTGILCTVTIPRTQQSNWEIIGRDVGMGHFVRRTTGDLPHCNDYRTEIRRFRTTSHERRDTKKLHDNRRKV